VFFSKLYYLLIKRNIYVKSSPRRCNVFYFPENTNHLFNREVTDGNADFFGNEAELSEILNRIEANGVTEEHKTNVKNRVINIYNWDRIIDIYYKQIQK
jgi:hypothetical protein